MQVNVKSIEYLLVSVNILNKFSEQIKEIAQVEIDKITRLLEEVIQELNLSNNFLLVAKAQEAQKFAILTQKEAKLASALQKEAAALASENPVAIAAATAYVAKKSQEVYIANQNYQRAKKNRIKIERRVELVNRAKLKNERVLEETKNTFKANISNINSVKSFISNRLQNAYRELSEYFTCNEGSADLDNLESIIRSNERNRIDRQSKYSSDINEYISTTKELEIYQNENLEEGVINGRTVLKDNWINLNLKDARERTNLDRIKKGLAPLDEDGRPYNLHHVGQKADSPLAELKDSVHKKNDAILHNKNIPTEVHGSDINWDKGRSNQWKARAKKIQEEMEEEDV